MKIVILADYSSGEFNKDFKLSNMLLGREHSVFMAISGEQFEFFLKNCDLGVIGYSAKPVAINTNKKIYIVDKSSDISKVLSDIS